MPDIFEQARLMCAQQRNRGMTQSEAMSILSKRGAAARRARRNYGVLHVTNTDRRQFDALEAPRELRLPYRDD